MKTLWHGSKDIIWKPEFGKGKPYNDYGPGFYCTERKDMAMEWAVGRERDGYANCYELHDDGLDVLYLNSPAYGVLDWIGVLLENRTFDLKGPLAAEGRAYLLAHFVPDYRSKDLIVGYRADDSYFSFAQDFLNGAISLRQLALAMKLGKLGEQVVLKSRKAFDRIEFVMAETAYAADWYAAKTVRDRTARAAYFDRTKNARQKGDLYITQILDEEIKPGDARLTEQGGEGQ